MNIVFLRSKIVSFIHIFNALFLNIIKREIITPFVYIIITIFIALFIVERTTVPIGFNFDWFWTLANALRYIIFFLALITCFLYERTLKLVICVVYFILSYISGKYGNSWFLFDLFFIPLFLSKKIKVKTVISISFYVLLIGTLLTVVLDLCNVLPKLKVFYAADGAVRYNLGFSHPNSLGFMCMLIGMTFLLNVKKIDFKCIPMLLLLGTLCIVVPKSRTSAFVLFFMSVGLLAVILFQNFYFSIKVRKVLGIAVLLVFTVIIILMYYIALTGSYNGAIFQSLGSFWARFAYGAKSFHDYGFSAIGQPYHPVGTAAIMNGADSASFFVVDCLYFYAPVFIGIIPTLVYLTLVYRAVWNSIRQCDFVFLLVQVSIFIYALSEYLIIFPVVMFAYLNLAPAGRKLRVDQTVDNLSEFKSNSYYKTRYEECLRMVNDRDETIDKLIKKLESSQQELHDYRIAVKTFKNVLQRWE